MGGILSIARIDFSYNLCFYSCSARTKQKILLAQRKPVADRVCRLAGYAGLGACWNGAPELVVFAGKTAWLVLGCLLPAGWPGSHRFLARCKFKQFGTLARLNVQRHSESRYTPTWLQRVVRLHAWARSPDWVFLHIGQIDVRTRLPDSNCRQIGVLFCPNPCRNLAQAGRPIEFNARLLSTVFSL